MEGTLRRAGARLRIIAQLVDASSGAELLAQAYDRPFRPEGIFELQDDLVPRIVSTVADTHGILPHSMSEPLRDKDPAQLSPYEAVLRSFAHFQRVNAEEHAAAVAGLEQAVQQAPMPGRCYTKRSTRTDSTSGLIPSDVRLRLRAVRSKGRRPITSRITHWRQPCSSAGSSKLSGSRRTSPSH
jgi:hypothetical protein